MSADIPWLRRQPRQQRSRDAVETLLDAADAVFHEVGFDAATTHLIAERAGVPVGSLYTWFDDKHAMAEGLAARYLDRLVARYSELIADGPIPRTRLLEATRELGAIVVENPGLPAIVRAAARSGNRGALRAMIEGAIDTIIRIRIPEVTDHDVRRMVRVATAVTIALLAEATDATAVDDGITTDEIIDELGYLVTAWLYERFPVEGDPVWDDPDPRVPPIAAAKGPGFGTGGVSGALPTHRTARSLRVTVASAGKGARR